MKGIDVSSYQGEINWRIVKNNVDFAIIRLGYGDDVESQDDKQFLSNVKGCIDNGIPFGVYLYSYAKNLAGSESIDSEVKHCLRQLNKISQKPFCVYIAMEDKSTEYLQKLMLTNYALEFCKQITNVGYKAGVYANENWFKNYLNCSKIASYGYSIWCAKYSSNKPNITSNYDIWQYSDNGKVDGINGNVDMNELFNNGLLGENKPIQKQIDITYQIWDDVKNKWLPNVVNDTDYAGIYGHDVCCVYASSNVGNLHYKVHYKGGKWLPEVINRNDYAGLFNKPIDGFMIKSDSKQLTYRLHLRRQNRWLSWVTGYNQNDSDNGFAGILGQEIDALQIK